MPLITRKLRFCFCLVAFLTVPVVLSCITYDISRGNLTLNCKIEDISTSIKIIDNENKTQAFFDLKNPCRVYTPGSICITNSSLREVILSVANFDAQMAGVWTCVTEYTQYTTNISDLLGIANGTEVNIRGDFDNNTSVNISCASCKTAYTSSAEFLIDHKSVDTITYDKDETVCFNKDNSCLKGDVCSCLPQQNTFSRVFRINTTAPKYVFSCYMKFKGGDEDDGIIFGKKSSITVMDKMFLNKESETIVLNQWNRHGQFLNTTPAYNEIKLNTILSRLILMIAVPIFALALIAVAVTIVCVRRKKKKDKNQSSVQLKTFTPPSDSSSTSIQCQTSDSTKDLMTADQLPYL